MKMKIFNFLFKIAKLMTKILILSDHENIIVFEKKFFLKN